MSLTGRQRGKLIVLAASDSESSEYQSSTWRQMLLATLPAKYARYIGPEWSIKNDVASDGQALYVPHGLRIVEALLLRKFARENIAVCHPGRLHSFVGPETRVVGIHAHNPLGITFATDVYARFGGRKAEPINAFEFRRLIQHPVLRQHHEHLKVIVGGPGAWQIEKRGLQQEWGIDCLVDGEAEEIVTDLFEKAIRGEELPLRMRGHSPKPEKIPPICHRSTFGAVEITRGCGRGCQFCSVALRAGRSFPLPQIIDNVRVQASEGAETILLVTEDIFLYEHGNRFAVNWPALKRLFHSVSAVEGVQHVMLTHGTIAPVVLEPGMFADFTPHVVDKSKSRHIASTHPEKRYANLFIGLETGSVRLFKQFMRGKAYPYRPEQWPDVVFKGIEILNKNNWFPFCTFILGLPGETREDTKKSLDLLYALKDAKWCVLPTLFVPLEDTRMKSQSSAHLFELTDLQWEFFFTCWRYNIDFFRNTRSVQWKFNVGIPLYYYLMGRKLFGSALKYPLLRLAHVPERFLRRKLYLDFSSRGRIKCLLPNDVLPYENGEAVLPVLD